MASKLEEPEFTPRDGTSQKGRAIAALEPGYVAVDERTVADLVAFAREYGKGLTYFGLDNLPAGDWSGFVGSLEPKDVAAFLNDPSLFRPEASPALFRPHFVLFLAFLKLFQNVQTGLNNLTGRHLEFYFRQVLQMARKGPIPDRVNLILDLARGSTAALVPQGSPVDAGKDSLGRERIYTTDRDLVVNRAQIAKLSALLVQRQWTGIREARENLPSGSPKEVVGLAMLRMALGDPLPGDPLPPYPGPGGTELDFAKLIELDSLTQLTKESSGFYLELSELRDLMRLKKIADELEVSLEEAVAQGRETEFLEAQLTQQWNKINAVLELAGQRKRGDPTYQLPAGHDPRAFTANAQSAVGQISVGGQDLGLEAYWNVLQEIEEYFFMALESFHRVIQQLVDPMTGPGWDRVDALLEAAHREKVRDVRRGQLRKLGTNLESLIQHVMEDPSATDEDLQPFLGQSATIDQLRAAAGSGDWERVYSILEVVLRNRIGEPSAETEKWLNLFPAEDVTLAGARPVLEGQQRSPRWAPFGLLPPMDKNVRPAAVLGWAISSPVLSLSEGTRTITLTLGFGAGAHPDALEELLKTQAALRLEVSTQKGWVECQAKAVTFGPYSVLLGGDVEEAPEEDPLGVQFKLEIGPSVDPICALPAELEPIDRTWPALRLMLRPIWSDEDKQYVVRYRELGGLIVSAAHIKVGVSGLKSIQLQNEEAVLSAKKPFEPFGITPSVGSRLLIGHPEVVTKRLDSLTFDFEWMGAPADLEAHYANYGLDTPVKFTAKVGLIDRGRVTELAAAAALFPAGTPQIVIGGNGSVVIPAPGDLGMEPAVAFGEELTGWRRYLQWELNAPDFQHGTYPAVASRKALELAIDISKQQVKNVNDYKVNPPYTPKIKTLTLGYSSSVEVRLDAAPVDAPGARIFHVHPFGHSDIEAERSSAGLPFLPRYENDGEFYIGLRGTAAPQTVSILFQMAEGSANPELESEPIRWSYLSGNRWLSLDDRVLLDTTRGLANSGIIEFALVQAEPNTRLPSELYWIRASVARGTSGVCDAIALHTQAVSATFVDRNNAPDHFREPLPPETITRLASEVRGISGVRQPYTSHGGRTAEGDAMWATRVGERLRHKQRAVTMWDYERLVLEHFPEVYKAKCIPAGSDQPGRVDIIVIPDIRNLLPSDPFAPRAPSKLLTDVEAYLATRSPAFASIKVRNARYMAVRVRLRVRFRDEGNENYYARKLNDELNRFLSPWAYEEGADIVIGGRIYANSIVDFVDRRPYVDYVAGVRLFRSSDGETFHPAPRPEGWVGDWNSDFVETDQPDEILVAARTHVIDVLHDAVYDERLMTGIGFMKVELDFIVG
ncbi:baseplate J/gp47 family protein [Vitiosangium sp. GDMCC 1.1324]|uniref:baseplate J/gp47 family protein n=1 Tax=Vitiosangium sp. (strain GDMCC 1.1324) TaxID=2138576 RepID=UPI000D3B6CD0|nr:baseplate J/gp47 family protein [Vitiosangium sp. GDMCC 1.1324]PTL78098.1 hypothetical protein DAT35_41530 [Vitiosangium sp. GDMCC 1.1324]